MGRVYSAPIVKAGVSTAEDFFTLVAPSDATLVIHEVHISQDSDFGDSQAEVLRVQTRRVASVGASGSIITPAPHSKGDPAFGGTVRANDTLQAPASGETIMQERAFNVQAGHFYQPAPEERIEISPGEILCISLPVAPADALDMVGTIVFEAIGG